MLRLSLMPGVGRFSTMLGRLRKYENIGTFDGLLDFG